MSMQQPAIHSVEDVTRRELDALIERPEGPCVSCFLPIEHHEPARHQQAVRLANQLRQAEQRLMARGLDARATRELLAPLTRLVSEQAFWTQLDDGLAAYAGADLWRVYSVPQNFEELVVVDTRPYIVPMLPVLQSDRVFYVLTLGLGGVRLLRGTRNGLQSIALHDIPANLNDALSYDEFARQGQFHPAGAGRDSESGTVFYGHGGRDGTIVKQEIRRYFQIVEYAVRRSLRGLQAPLVLAGIAYLLPLYRSVNTYTSLLDDDLPINPDDLKPEELRSRVWDIISRSFEHERRDILERYRQAYGSHPELATSYLRAVIPAAYQGRVDTLLVAAGRRCWGSFDPVSGALEQHDGPAANNHELCNQAAIQVMRFGGMVHVMTPDEMPEASPLAAILR